MKKPEQQLAVEQLARAQLYKAITSLKSAAETQAFFEDLCSPAELQLMADRWRVVPLLQQEIPYRKIYEETGVSVTTVGRVARNINYGTGGYQRMLNKMKREQKKS